MHKLKPVLFLLLCGCSTKEVKHKTTEPIKKPPIEVEKPSIPQDYNSKIDRFIAVYVQDWDTSAFSNEFSYDGRILNETEFSSSEKLAFKRKKAWKDKAGKTYYPRFQLISYAYKDSGTCSTAFDRFLRNFGSMGVPIRKNVTIGSFQSAPAYVIKTPKEITAVFMDCVYLHEDWTGIKANLEQTLSSKNDSLSIVECGCGGPVTWK